MRRVAAAVLCGGLVLGTAGCQSDAFGASSSGRPPSATSTSATGGPHGPAATTATGSGSATATPTSSTGPTPSARARPGTALAALMTLSVKGRAPKTGYDRDRFGQRWADVDRNGCDTRNDVLRRDLRSFVLKAGTHGCLVLEGTLHDPYTGSTIGFVRGEQTSIAVQIDHVVALSDAWQKGAQSWSPDKRERFANDPLNLLAVDGPTNSRKSDGDAATWLPPAKGYRCRYVARQVAVKKAYGLWVTSAEKAAIARVLQACPAEPLPRSSSIPLGGGPERTVAAPSTSTTSSGGSVGLVDGGDVYYKNCDAVRAAGADPIRVGDPGYDRRLDRDGDGVGCE